MATANTRTGTGTLSAESLYRALSLFGDQWTLLILQSLFLRVRRFTDLRARLGVADAVLSARLRTLVDQGVLTRIPYKDEQRTRHEYRLTGSGIELWSLLIAIWAWERTWVPGHSVDLPDLCHLACGQSAVPRLACGRCGLPVTAHDTAAERTPGLPVRDAVGARRFRRKDWDRVAGRPLLFFPETMNLLGDRWVSAVLAAALLGVRRFTEFERELGIRPSVLTGKLRRMVEAGVLAPASAGQQPGRSQYRLTDKGVAFFPVFALIIDWAGRWLTTRDEPGIRVDHPACAGPLVPTLQCNRCGRRLERGRVRFVL